jgi:PTH1 family peptidyl-tRNA hydrolase
MKLIVGLGNPGKEYQNTRHNFGFLTIDKVAEQVGAPAFKLEKKFYSEICEVEMSGQKVILAKPVTFMNLSGKAVSAIATFYKIGVSDIWVIADELDLPLGTMRVKLDTVSSTHNGIRNIIEALGTTDFTRFRLGINTETQLPADEFVLSRFTTAEQSQVNQIIEKSSELILRFLKDDLVKSETIDLNE